MCWDKNYCNCFPKGIQMQVAETFYLNQEAPQWQQCEGLGGKPGDPGSGPDSASNVCATETKSPALPEDLTASF